MFDGVEAAPLASEVVADVISHSCRVRKPLNESEVVALASEAASDVVPPNCREPLDGVAASQAGIAAAVVTCNRKASDEFAAFASVVVAVW